MVKYDADYFIRKFEKIPEERWTTRKYRRGSRCCALGHCGEDSDVSSVEAALLSDLINESFPGVWGAAEINDGLDEAKVLGDSPKERILVALENIKGAGG